MASLHLSLLLLSTITLSILYGTIAGDRETHLHFYMHDTLSGPNATAFRVVQGPVNASGLVLNFGHIVVFDDPLTAKPELTSKLVGRAQGFYIPASLSSDTEQFALYLAVNLVLSEGKYNGSTLSIVGRDVIFSPVRELSVVGGSGMFRKARGYVEWTTNYVDSSGNAILDLNVFVDY